MNKVFKKVLITGLISLIFILVSIHLIDKVMEYSDSEIDSYFKERSVNYQIFHHQSTHGLIRVVKSGESKENAIICIHGAPGSWDAFKSYMVDSTLLGHAEIISYDRPGYGPYQNKPVTDLKSQAEILNYIIRSYTEAKNIILLSHSYGGPIVVKFLSANSDTRITHLMVAPAIDPESEKYFWVSPLGYWKTTKWLLPTNYISASYEKYSHVGELNKLLPELGLINNQTIHVHGKEDWLAPADGNISFVWKNFPPTMTQQIILPKGGHLLIWDQYDTIKDQLLAMMNRDK